MTRQEILADFPKGEDHKSLQRDLKNVISNLERQLCVVKQFEDVSGRRRRLSLFHRVVDVYEAMDFEDALVDVIKRMGPVKAFTLRYYVSRSVEELAIALRNLENQGRVAKVMALVPEPEAFYVVPEEVAKTEYAKSRRQEATNLNAIRPICLSIHLGGKVGTRQRLVLTGIQGVDPIGKVLMFK